MKPANTGRFVTDFYPKYRIEEKDHPDFWVLYTLHENGAEEFFILSHAEMAQAQAERNFRGGVPGVRDARGASGRGASTTSWRVTCMRTAEGGKDRPVVRRSGARRLGSSALS